VCVCVCEREREREREGGGEAEEQNHTVSDPPPQDAVGPRRSSQLPRCVVDVRANVKFEGRREAQRPLLKALEHPPRLPLLQELILLV
jgi:hypothetical protein